MKTKIGRSDIRRIAKQFRDDVLELSGGVPDMMCFAVCAPLDGYLGFLGVDCKLVEGDFGRVNHVWIEFPDGTICDPTADQFTKPSGEKMPAVYLGPKPDWYRQSVVKGGV